MRRKHVKSIRKSIAMDKNELDMLYKVSVAAAEQALINAGLKRASITRAEAIRQRKEHTIRRWEKEGLITPLKQGASKNSQVCYSIEELNKAELSDNLYKLKRKSNK